MKPENSYVALIDGHAGIDRIINVHRVAFDNLVRALQQLTDEQLIAIHRSFLVNHRYDCRCDLPDPFDAKALLSQVARLEIARRLKVNGLHRALYGDSGFDGIPF